MFARTILSLRSGLLRGIGPPGRRGRSHRSSGPRGRSPRRRGRGRDPRRRRCRAPSSRASPRGAPSAGRSRTRPSVDFRLVPSRIGRPRIRSVPSSRTSSRLCSGVLPNPNPGSTIRSSQRTPSREGPLDRALEVGDQLGEERRVAGLGPVVHDDQRDAVLRREPGEGVVVTDPPDVVDEVGAGSQGGLGHGWLRRVDAQRRVGEGRTEGRDDRDDPAPLLVGVDGARGPAASIRHRRRGGRRRPPPSPPRRDGGLDRPPRPRPAARPASASRPSPENESGVTLRMPITNVRSPQRNVTGPMREGAGWLACGGSVMRPRRDRDRAAPGRRRGDARTAPTR